MRNSEVSKLRIAVFLLLQSYTTVDAQDSWDGERGDNRRGQAQADAQVVFTRQI